MHTQQMNHQYYLFKITNQNATMYEVFDDIEITSKLLFF